MRRQAIIVFGIAALLGLLVNAVTPPQAHSVSERTPSTVVSAAFASLQAPSFSGPGMLRPQAQESCSDFDFAFLHSKCVSVRRKHSLSRSRVATLVSQRAALGQTSNLGKRTPARVKDDQRKLQPSLAN